MVNYYIAIAKYTAIANYVVEEYLNVTKIYIFHEVKKWVTNGYILPFLLGRHNICTNGTSI